MMIHTSLRTLLLLFFCSLCCATAADGTTEEALILTGVKEEIAQTTPELFRHFLPLRQDLQPAFARAYDSLAAAMFQPDELYSSALSLWTTRYDSSRTQRVLAWLRSGVGKAITDREKAAYTKASDNDIPAYAKKADSDKKLKKRLAAFEKTVDNTAHSKAEVVVVMSRQLIQIANALHSDDQILTNDQIGDMTERMRPDLLHYYRGLSRGFYGYALRSTPEKQVAEYTQFLASEDGQWFQNERRFAIAQAYHMAGAQFVISLKSAFDAIVEQPEDSTTAAYLNNILKKRTENSRVLGVVEATANGKDWVGYLNAETNSDSTVTLLALNTDREPQEQIEITFPFTGVATYPIAKEQGVYFRLGKDRTPIEVYYSVAKPSGSIVVTGYDELQHAIEGTINASFVGESGTIAFKTKPFIVRIRR